MLLSMVLWFYGGVAGSLSFFAWSAYATNVGKSLPAFKVEVTSRKTELDPIHF